jgi:ubiquinone/menaquinone biosynthesis C-methylase UbiE
VDDIARAMRALYDSHADEYVDTTGSYDHFPGLRDEVDRFIAKTPASGPVLDLGCGVGRDSQYFLAHSRPTVAVDISLEMLRITRERCFNSTSLRLVLADMGELPFGDGTFLGVWVCASLLHVPSERMEHILREIARIVRRGGIVSISMKAGRGEGYRTGCSLAGRRWFTLVEPSEFAASLSAAGFTELEIISSGRREWFIAEAIRC